MRTRWRERDGEQNVGAEAECDVRRRTELASLGKDKSWKLLFKTI